jgi:hypothetical protein
MLTYAAVAQGGGKKDDQKKTVIEDSRMWFVFDVMFLFDFFFKKAVWHLFLFLNLSVCVCVCAAHIFPRENLFGNPGRLRTRFSDLFCRLRAVPSLYIQIYIIYMCTYYFVGCVLPSPCPVYTYIHNIYTYI